MEVYRLGVYRCPQGHVKIGPNQETLEIGCWCSEKGQAPFAEVTDPNELMAMAEVGEREIGHKEADAALLARMRQLDPEFATRYEQILARGFWYA